VPAKVVREEDFPNSTAYEGHGQTLALAEPVTLRDMASRKPGAMKAIHSTEDH